MKSKKSKNSPPENSVEIAPGLEKYVLWLDQLINDRMNAYFADQNDPAIWAMDSIGFPEPDGHSPLEITIRKHELTPAEVLVVVLALIPHLKPQMLDIFFAKNTLFDRGFTEFGGIKSETFGGFVPTAETAIFLLSGSVLSQRLHFWPIFQPSGRLFRLQLLQTPNPNHSELDLAYPLWLTSEAKNLLLTGTPVHPEFSEQFPARQLSTPLDWEDLVLDQITSEDLLEIHSWIRNRKVLLEDWGMDRFLKPGFRSLFYGPPGTGKSLSAALLGKVTGFDVFRIDLSMVVSKFIGETEKNLANIFDQGQQRDWILFFDEADALFGKRTTTTSSHDRYANQEVSYLLQRIEDYPGLVILATNFKNNIDSAFMRRFQSVVQFLKPDEQQRLRLWKLAMEYKIPTEGAFDLEGLAEQYEITGGEIVNIIRHAALLAVESTPAKMTMEHILAGIKREMTKDGRMFELWRGK